MTSQSQKSSDLVVKTSARGTIIAGILAFVALFAGGGVWAYVANLSGAVIAHGTVVVPGKPKTVQHLDGGIVAEIKVSDGDTVKRGDLIVRLDDTLLKANLNIYRNRLREGIARKARLIAERDGLDAIKWDDKLLKLLKAEQLPEVKKGQERLFRARKATRAGQISQLEEKIAQFRNQAKGIEALKASKKTQIDFLEEELKGARALKKKGLISTSRLLTLERQREDLVGQNAEHDAALSRILNSISETKIQILQIEREFRQNVLTELRKTVQEVNDTTQQLYATREQLRRIEVRAPVAGIVHELSVFTVGGVVAAGAQIAQIIPQDGLFAIEAKVEPQFIDRLHPDQEAALRFSAFNRRTTPVLLGKVKNISANVLSQKRTGLSYYLIKISVSQKQLDRLNGQKLIPGMPVEVFITTQKHSALSYLLKPLTDQFKHALRER